MSGAVIIFYLFGGMAIVSSFGVAASRNPLTGSVWLLGALFAVAGLFAFAGAHFLAAMQILVYAGAVAVLFIFVIMLLNLSDRELGRMEVGPPHVAGLGFVLVMLVGISAVSLSMRSGFPEISGSGPGGTEQVGQVLLRSYLLPFEVISLVLLASMAGAVMLVKRASSGEAIEQVQKIREMIDRRGSRAFVPDASLPEQHGPPERQLPPAANTPEVGVSRSTLDPGETV